MLLYLKSKSSNLEKGVFVLSIYFLLNILPGIGSLFYIFFGNHAPALIYLFTTSEIQSLGKPVLNTVDGLAILFNTLIVMYSLLAFFVVQKSLLKKEKWSFFLLLFITTVMQLVAYITDDFFMGKNLVILNIASVILIVGFWLSAQGLFIKKRKVKHS